MKSRPRSAGLCLVILSMTWAECSNEKTRIGQGDSETGDPSKEEVAQPPAGELPAALAINVTLDASTIDIGKSTGIHVRITYSDGSVDILPVASCSSTPKGVVETASPPPQIVGRVAGTAELVCSKDGVNSDVVRVEVKGANSPPPPPPPPKPPTEREPDKATVTPDSGSAPLLVDVTISSNAVSSDKFGRGQRIYGATWGDGSHTCFGTGTGGRGFQHIYLVPGTYNLTGYAYVPSNYLQTYCDPYAYSSEDKLPFDGSSPGNATVKVLPPVSPASSIATGVRHSCALTQSHNVWCWGENDPALLGGSSTDPKSPVRVSGLSSVSGLSAGYSHTCVVLADQTLRCWGDNSSNQLGDGSSQARSAPVAVSGVSSAISVTAGFGHTCALLSDGTAVCWGANDKGQLGNGTFNPSNTPAAVTGLQSVTSLVAGREHTCALTSVGSISCWGYNGNGQLGDRTRSNRTLPTIVSGLGTAKSVAPGGDHTCAIQASGEVVCWGANSLGQLGNGTTSDSDVPVVVKWQEREWLAGGGERIVREWQEKVALVFAGDSHTCALSVDSTLWCWGANQFRQAGLLLDWSGSADQSPHPLPATVSRRIVSPPRVTAVSAAADRTCAVMQGGAVRCWGKYAAFNMVESIWWAIGVSFDNVLIP